MPRPVAPNSLASLRSALAHAARDGKVDAADVKRLTERARKDGVTAGELEVFSRALTRQGDRFDVDAKATLAVFIDSKGLATKDLDDPAVLSEHVDRLGWTWTDGALAVDGIKATDITQGYIGDCYLVSALASVAHLHPDAIARAMKDLGDGTVAVTFQTATGPHTVVVDKELPTADGKAFYARSTDVKELWGPLLEKAFAEFTKRGYAGIDGMKPEVVTTTVHVMTLLVGGQPAGVDLKNGGHGDDVIFETLKSLVDQTLPTILSTGPEPDRYVNTGLYGSHGYSLLGVVEENGQRFVELRNPWGFAEPAGNGADDGVFRLPIADVTKHFDGVLTVMPGTLGQPPPFTAPT
ncbi:MAG: C2 family cysteine protease [Myxococcaceae bacterium]|nr:C2 family cysteine protease [Myxococcaceae bacterium]